MEGGRGGREGVEGGREERGGGGRDEDREIHTDVCAIACLLWEKNFQVEFHAGYSACSISKIYSWLIEIYL